MSLVWDKSGVGTSAGNVAFYPQYSYTTSIMYQRTLLKLSRPLCQAVGQGFCRLFGRFSRSYRPGCLRELSVAQGAVGRSRHCGAETQAVNKR